MKREDKLYRRYLEILREELTPAMGCTEPIAVAYAAAKARELLGDYIFHTHSHPSERLNFYFVKC